MSNISRRTFLGISAATLGFGSYVFLNNTRSFHYLSKQGLPSEFESVGFKIGPYTEKGTPEEVLIISEDHDFPDVRKHESKFIDYLVSSYQVDALGLEGLYGKPRTGIDDEVEKEFREYIKGLNPEVISREKLSDSPFKKYVNQLSIPCYGIENKELYLRVMTRFHFMKAIAIVNRSIFSGRLAYSKIPNINLIEQFINDVRDKFPNENYPSGSLEAMTNTHSLRPGLEQFSKETVQLWIMTRNQSFAKNVPESMHALNAKKGIVIAGSLHTNARTSSNFQNYLPYSSLIVRTG